MERPFGCPVLLQWASEEMLIINNLRVNLLQARTLSLRKNKLKTQKEPCYCLICLKYFKYSGCLHFRKLQKSEKYSPFATRLSLVKNRELVTEIWDYIVRIPS